MRIDVRIRDTVSFYLLLTSQTSSDTVTRDMELQYDRPSDLSNTDALHLLSNFFPKEWKHLKETDITTTRCQMGANTRVYFVERTVGRNEIEPNKVVIRKYSSYNRGFESYIGKRPAGGMRATELEQSIILVQLAKRGLGPELYGVFQTDDGNNGRIEEFIACRRITFEESRNPVFESDIAKNMALIHATSVPLPRPGYLFADALQEIYEDLVKYIGFYEELGEQKTLNILKHNFGQEIDFLRPLLHPKHHTIVLMNWDPHFDNIAVRETPTPAGLKTIIFDYENASCNIRAKDLGLFLISRSGYFPIVRNDRRLETSEEFTSFLQAYISEWQKETGSTDPLKDTIEHLLIESLIGGMTSCLCFFFMISSWAAKNEGEGEGIDVFVKFIPILFECYNECKAALIKNLPDKWED